MNPATGSTTVDGNDTSSPVGHIRADSQMATIGDNTFAIGATTESRAPG